MLTTNTDKIIINLRGGPLNNIEGPSEILQKFITEQVPNKLFTILKLS